MTLPAFRLSSQSDARERPEEGVVHRERCLCIGSVWGEPCDCARRGGACAWVLALWSTCNVWGRMRRVWHAQRLEPRQRHSLRRPPGCPWPEFRKIFSEIWARSLTGEISTKIGPISAFLPRKTISRKFRVSSSRSGCQRLGDALGSLGLGICVADGLAQLVIYPRLE